MWAYQTSAVANACCYPHCTLNGHFHLDLPPFHAKNQMKQLSELPSEMDSCYLHKTLTSQIEKIKN